MTFVHRSNRKYSPNQMNTDEIVCEENELRNNRSAAMIKDAHIDYLTLFQSARHVPLSLLLDITLRLDHRLVKHVRLHMLMVFRFVCAWRRRVVDFRHVRLDAERVGGRMVQAHLLRLVGARCRGSVSFGGRRARTERVRWRMIENYRFRFVGAGS